MTSYTFGDIRDRIKSNLQNPTSRIEGTFSMDNTGAVAQELARMMAMDVLPIIDNAMLDTAEGIMLDRKALDFNITRNPAKKAVGAVTFVGDVGMVVPLATVTLADSLEFVTMTDGIIGADGKAVVASQCVILGDVGNVSVGKIGAIKQSLNGIKSAVNEADFSGGVDEESDDLFRERILEKIRVPITSGNKNHYIFWAKQVSGVGKAKVIPCWNGNGTVKVILLSDIFDTPDSVVIQNVARHIEEQRPIGASVTVVAATSVMVTIAVTLSIVDGYSLSDITASITHEITEYLKAISFDTTKQLSYYKIGDIIFDVNGVLDIISYTLNGGFSSLGCDFEEFFKLKGVVVNGG